MVLPPTIHAWSPMMVGTDPVTNVPALLTTMLWVDAPVAGRFTAVTVAAFTVNASAPALPIVTSPSKLAFPPTLRRPPTPAPPVTMRAPVPVVVLAVLSVMDTADEKVLEPDIFWAPVVSTKDPVVPTSGIV